MSFMQHYYDSIGRMISMERILQNHPPELEEGEEIYEVEMILNHRKRG